MTDDPTSLGAVLITLDLITEEQLKDAVEKQKRVRDETILGLILVDAGVITKGQLEVAVSAQKSMRQGKRYKRAVGMADMAIQRHRRKSVVARRQRLLEKHTLVTQAILCLDD